MKNHATKAKVSIVLFLMCFVIIGQVNAIEDNSIYTSIHDNSNVTVKKETPSYEKSITLVEIERKQSKELVEFKAKYGENWKVHWNEYTETPKSVYGSANLGVGNITTEDKAKEAVWSFVSDNKDFLKADLSDLTFARIQRDEGTWSVGYDQYYQGVPVYKGGIGATISDRGNLLSFGSSFYPNISLSITPLLSENESIEIAKDEARSLGLTIDSSTRVREASLVVFPKPVGDSLEYYLTWKVSIHTPFEWGYEFFVDAQSAEIVHADSTVKYISDGNKQTSEDDSKLVFIAIAIVVVLSALLLILRRRLT